MKKLTFEFVYSFFLISIASIFIIAVVGSCGVTIYDQTNRSDVSGVTVLDLQQQQKISGSGKDISTEIRFVVVTDKETFVVKNSLLNGKFANSDIFYRLEKGKKYDFKVAGIGKSIFTDYRNVLSYSLNQNQ